MRQSTDGGVVSTSFKFSRGFLKEYGRRLFEERSVEWRQFVTRRDGRTSTKDL